MGPMEWSSRARAEEKLNPYHYQTLQHFNCCNK